MFEDFEVISQYTDKNAVEDGVLVPLDAKNRVTRPAFEFLAENTPIATAQPPNNWPVEMMGWFRTGSVTQADALKRIAKHGLDAQAEFEKEIRAKRAIALAKGLIGKFERQARRVYDENLDGGIFKVWPKLTGDVLTGVDENSAGKSSNEPLWIMPNENGGMTLMFPSDY